MAIEFKRKHRKERIVKAVRKTKVRNAHNKNFIELKTLYSGGVFTPLETVKIPERAKVLIRIEKVEPVEGLKHYSYLKLLKEGEDAEKLFEF